MGYKDQVKRDVVKWRDTARKVFFHSVNKAPEDVRAAVMFDMTDDKLNDIATHQNERLISNTINGVIDMMVRRKELIEEFAELAGQSEHLSELDLLWVLKYGIEMYEDVVKEAFQDERDRVYSRMVTAGFTNRVNSVLSGGIVSRRSPLRRSAGGIVGINEQKTQDQSE